MGDRTAQGAVEMLTEPDYEAMVIGAHPDDNDFGTAATCALWASQGKKVVWVVMTDGTEGSEIPSQSDEELMLLREQEQRAAAEVYGIKAVEFLRNRDGHLVNNEDTRRAVVKLIRKYRPRVIFTHDPTSHIMAPDPDEKPDATGYLNHPDHRATGNIVVDSIFPFAGNPRSFRELLAEGLQPYRVHEVYFFGSTQTNTYVDVTESIDKKGQGLMCHKSQFNPEDNERMAERMRERAAAVAKDAKEKKGLEMRYAESFRRMKLHIPPAPKEETAVPAGSEE
ncbi:PIG-L deacetylase family protein [Dictyobacter aurantiacus]|uniref:GlcNAc-PI de-N-acetylase n=1 Tax=Dictyobacter aurantiacus TaxID=1936993 RepID=A0A401ZA39_9CHLR|nr:PIG-L deacetylase family protein [Dictyobacter aurantiacus]GCE03683.1 GlcNAc-PI de-N-acetylase [Dictyobacter aurantiacus]